MVSISSMLIYDAESIKEETIAYFSYALLDH